MDSLLDITADAILDAILDAPSVDFAYIDELTALTPLPAPANSHPYARQYDPDDGAEQAMRLAVRMAREGWEAERYAAGQAWTNAGQSARGMNKWRNESTGEVRYQPTQPGLRQAVGQEEPAGQPKKRVQSQPAGHEPVELAHAALESWNAADITTEHVKAMTEKLGGMTREQLHQLRGKLGLPKGLTKRKRSALAANILASSQILNSIKAYRKDGTGDPDEILEKMKALDLAGIRDLRHGLNMGEGGLNAMWGGRSASEVAAKIKRALPGVVDLAGMQEATEEPGAPAQPATQPAAAVVPKPVAKPAKREYSPEELAKIGEHQRYKTEEEHAAKMAQALAARKAASAGNEAAAIPTPLAPNVPATAVQPAAIDYTVRGGSPATTAAVDKAKDLPDAEIDRKLAEVNAKIQAGRGAHAPADYAEQQGLEHIRWKRQEAGAWGKEQEKTGAPVPASPVSPAAKPPESAPAARSSSSVVENAAQAILQGKASAVDAGRDLTDADVDSLATTFGIPSKGKSKAEILATIAEAKGKQVAKPAAETPSPSAASHAADHLNKVTTAPLSELRERLPKMTDEQFGKGLEALADAGKVSLANDSNETQFRDNGGVVTPEGRYAVVSTLAKLTPGDIEQAFGAGGGGKAAASPTTGGTPPAAPATPPLTSPGAKGASGSVQDSLRQLSDLTTLATTGATGADVYANDDKVRAGLDSLLNPLSRSHLQEMAAELKVHAPNGATKAELVKALRREVLSAQETAQYRYSPDVHTQIDAVQAKDAAEREKSARKLKAAGLGDFDKRVQEEKDKVAGKPTPPAAKEPAALTGQKQAVDAVVAAYDKAPGQYRAREAALKVLGALAPNVRAEVEAELGLRKAVGSQDYENIDDAIGRKQLEALDTAASQGKPPASAKPTQSKHADFRSDSEPRMLPRSPESDALQASLQKDFDQRIAPQLTPNETKALGIYTTNRYDDINRTLRGEAAPDEKTSKIIKHMDRAFEKAGDLPEPVITYRTINFKSPEQAAEFIGKFDASHKSGKPIEMKGYQSTTVDPGYLKTFGGDGDDSPVYFEIKARKGLWVDSVAVNGDVAEMVLPHANKYRVVGVKDVPFSEWKQNREMRGDDPNESPHKTEMRRVVQMEQLPHGEEPISGGTRGDRVSGGGKAETTPAGGKAGGAQQAGGKGAGGAKGESVKPTAKEPAAPKPKEKSPATPTSSPHDTAAIEQAIRTHNRRDPKHGTTPEIPAIHDAINAERKTAGQPPLTDAEFHAVLHKMQREGKLTLQAGGNAGQAQMTRNFKAERFPDHQRGGKATTIYMPDAPAKDDPRPHQDTREQFMEEGHRLGSSRSPMDWVNFNKAQKQRLADWEKRQAEKGGAATPPAKPRLPAPVVKPPADQADILSRIGKEARTRDLNDSMREHWGVHVNSGHEWRTGQKTIPPDVAKRFDAHGTNTLKDLTHLLNNGVDPDRNFYSETLGAHKDARLLREDSNFVVLGHPGKSITEGGIAGVLVDPLHTPSIPDLQRAFPGVKFVPAVDAARVLSQVAGKGGKAVEYPTAHSRPSLASQYIRLSRRAASSGDLASAEIYARQAREVL